MASQTGATGERTKRASSTAPLQRRAPSSKPASEVPERPLGSERPRIIRVGSTGSFQAPLSAHTTKTRDPAGRPDSRTSNAGSTILPASISGAMGRAGGATVVVAAEGGRDAPSDTEEEGDQTYREADTGATTIDIGGEDVTRNTRDEYDELDPSQGGWQPTDVGTPASPLGDRRNQEIRDRRREGTWGQGLGGNMSPLAGRFATETDEMGTHVIIGGPRSGQVIQSRLPMPSQARQSYPSPTYPEKPGPVTGAEAEESDGNFSETRGDGARKHISAEEQSKVDFELLMEIMNNKTRREELEKYKRRRETEGTRVGAVETLLDTGKKPQEGESSRAARKSKGKARAAGERRTSLGVSLKQPEGEKRAHIVAQTPAKRDPTHGMPSGGVLYKILAGKKGGVEGADPDDEGSSSSSSSSDSSDEDIEKLSPKEIAKRIKKLKKDRKERKDKEKLRKLQLSGFQAKLPTPYEGKPDYDLYEQFVYEITTWNEDTGFSDSEAVKHVKAFLQGKAGDFYMSHVAPDIQLYNMTALFRELFEYCFPPDVKAQLRKQFQRTTQGDQCFKDFARELKKLQRRIIDISDEQVAQRLWEGAHSYIRIEWARAGYSAEENTVAELEESAVRFEAAEMIRRTEEKKENKRREDWREPMAYDEKMKETSESDEDSESSDDDNDVKGREKGNGKARLSPEKVAEYRARGKCFNCSEVGHISRECPKRNNSKPKGISSLAVNFARIHELEDAADEALRVHAITLGGLVDKNIHGSGEIRQSWASDESRSTRGIEEPIQRAYNPSIKALTTPRVNQLCPVAPSWKEQRRDKVILLDKYTYMNRLHTAPEKYMAHPIRKLEDRNEAGGETPMEWDPFETTCLGPTNKDKTVIGDNNDNSLFIETDCLRQPGGRM